MTPPVADVDYRRLVETVRGYAMVLLDRDGTLRSFPAAAERMTGYRAAEALGANVAIFYPEAERDAGLPARDLERAAREGEIEMEGWRMRKDGSAMWSMVTLTALRDGDGALLGFAKITRDGKAYRELALLDTLFQAAPVGLVFFDRALVVVRINEYLARVTGQPVAAHLGRSIHELLPLMPSDAPLMRALRGVAGGGHAVDSLEVTTETAPQPGKKRIFRISLFPVLAGGTLLGAGAVVVEITGRRRSEEERDLFLAALGHDLRNPLSAILIAAQLLEATLETPAAQRVAAQVVSGARRMSRLINDLLDLARARSGGGIPLTLTTVDLRQLCAEVIAEARMRAPDRDIELTACDEAVGRHDRDRVFQIVQNLVANAVEHGAPGTPITVAVTVDETADAAQISVTNEGPPIPDELCRHIFDPFYSARRRTGGLGLGLFIARQLAVAHGGTIEVDSTRARTVFTTRLPRNGTARGL